MNINKLNYEALMIDYIEGSLNKEERLEMELFLSEHPKLNKEVNLYLEAPILKENLAIILTNKSEYLKDDSRRKQVIWGILFLIVSSLTIWYLINSKKETIEQKPIVQTPNQLNQKESRIAHNLTADKVETVEKVTKSNIERELSEKSTISSRADKRNKLLIAQKTNKSNSERSNLQENLRLRNALPSTGKKMNRSKITTPQIAVFEDNLPRRSKIESVGTLPSIFQKNLFQTERSLNGDERNFSNHVLMAMESEQSQKKRKSWWKLFVPQAYKDMEIDNVFASNTLQSSAADIEVTTVPLQLITR